MLAWGKLQHGRLLTAAFVFVSCWLSSEAGVSYRRLLQGPAPYASLGPDPDLPGLSVEAVLDLWGVGLLPFGLDMQQTLLNVLNETVKDANEDELQLLAVEELLPLSGPASVTVNGSRTSSSSNSGRPSGPSQAPLPDSGGRRLLFEGASRRLLQALAQAGNPANVINLPHLEVRIRISTVPGKEDIIKQETVNAVNGPMLPLLNQQGVNVSFLQLAALSLNYGNGTSNPFPPARPRDGSGISHTAIGLIVAAGVLACLIGLVLALLMWWRRTRIGGVESEKGVTPGSSTSVQAESVHSLAAGMPGLLLLTGARPPSVSPTNSAVSSRSSQRSLEGEALQIAQIAGLDTSTYGLPFSELQFSRVIGEGSFGRVYLGKWRETTVAIKILNAPGGPLPDDSWDLHDLTQLKDASWSAGQQGPSTSQQLLVQELGKEATLMAGLRHPNIVLFLGVSPDPPCMVTEFCARGSLLDILHRARNNQAVANELDWRRRLRLLLDAAKGMLYLHSRHPAVLHRDLKSANLLVDKHWQVKVADFNLSRVMHSSAAVSSLAATNPRWLPPEVLAGNGYGAAADVYAFGIIMWELLTWQVPWEDVSPWQVVINVVDHNDRPAVPPPESLPGGVPAAGSHYLKVMRHCWTTMPEERPRFADIINDIRTMIDAQDQYLTERQNVEGHQQSNSSSALLCPTIKVDSATA